MIDSEGPIPAPRPEPRRLTRAHSILLALILATSAAVRLVELGRASFWYDEVVTIRLARSANPSALIRLLDRTDATRAPLHPLLLQGWVRLFGPGEASARGFSVLCGFAAVALIFAIGRRAFDTQSGLWAAWLGAISPLLIRYSRETRMYAWLTFLACLAWWLLLGFRRSASLPARIAFGAVLVAMAYSHPLGILMIGAIALGYLSDRTTSKLRPIGALAILSGVVLAILPWLGRYLDHPPESTVGRLDLKFLVGLPIGHTGGDSRILIVAAFLTFVGLFSTKRIRSDLSPPNRTVHLDDPATARLLLIWLVVPPVVLYAYSRVGHPIFGPPRYTLFVGPAYLILLGRGLARSRWFAFPVAAVLTILATLEARETVFDPNLKADWRSAAEMIREDGGNRPVVSISTGPEPKFEIETARYYLGPDIAIFPVSTAERDLGSIRPRPDFAWFAVNIRERRIAPYVPAPLAGTWRGREDAWLDGLKLELRQRLDPTSHRPAHANPIGP